MRRVTTKRLLFYCTTSTFCARASLSFWKYIDKLICLLFNLWPVYNFCLCRTDNRQQISACFSHQTPEVCLLFVESGCCSVAARKTEHQVYSPLQPGGAEHEEQHGHRGQDDPAAWPRDPSRGQSTCDGLDEASKRVWTSWRGEQVRVIRLMRWASVCDSVHEMNRSVILMMMWPEMTRLMRWASVWFCGRAEQVWFGGRCEQVCFGWWDMLVSDSYDEMNLAYDSDDEVSKCVIQWIRWASMRDLVDSAGEWFG